jgi:CubicO group peptidase (beta-lactamase class C family)
MGNWAARSDGNRAILRRATSLFLALLLVPALLTSCAGIPLTATVPTATRAAQISTPEPETPAATDQQRPTTAQLASTAVTTALPEGDAYWPTEAWRVSTPEEQDMDAALLQQMLDAIDDQFLNIDSVIVVRNGYIVLEKYYSPYRQKDPHDTWSITKSVVSALVGIAIQAGYIPSVDDPVLDYFPERTFENNDARKRAITVEHLLTLSSGLAWDWDDMVSSRDWVQYTLDQPMHVEPGTEFFYSSGDAHLLSAILQAATGLNTRDFAQRYLFDPLGISDVTWKTDLEGIAKGGWGLAMKPRDMAKLGYLYLNQGAWDGQQIIPARWIEASTTRHIQVPEPVEPWDLYMGYLWWVHGDGPYAAHGMKGQFIYVIPELDLVVVFTSDITDAKFAQPQLLIRDYVIPAVSPAGQ